MPVEFRTNRAVKPVVDWIQELVTRRHRKYIELLDDTVLQLELERGRLKDKYGQKHPLVVENERGVEELNNKRAAAVLELEAALSLHGIEGKSLGEHWIEYERLQAARTYRSNSSSLGFTSGDTSKGRVPTTKRSPRGSEKARTPQLSVDVVSIRDSISVLELERAKLKEKFAGNHPLVTRVEKDLAKYKRILSGEPDPVADPEIQLGLTFKGQPFSHWMQIAERDRSYRTVCDALVAAAEVADTADERSRVLTTVSRLSREHESVQMNASGPARSYNHAFRQVFRKFDSREIVAFVLDQARDGNRKSDSLCARLIRSWNVQNETQDENRVFNEALHEEVVRQADVLLTEIVLRLEQRDSLRDVLESLSKQLVPPVYGRSVRASQRKNGLQQIEKVKEQNPQIVPTLRKLFSESGPAGRLTLSSWVRGYCPGNPDVFKALRKDLYAAQTSPQIRDNIFYNFAIAEYRPATHERNSEVVKFLSDLYQNQIGPKEHRLQFDALARVTFTNPDQLAAPASLTNGMGMDMRSGGGMEMGMGRVVQGERTVIGPAALIRNILTTIADYRSILSQHNHPETIIPLLESLLDENNKDLDEYREDLAMLRVFEYAGHLLDHFEAAASQVSINQQVRPVQVPAVVTLGSNSRKDNKAFAQQMNRMKQIGLALYNYESAFTHFPASCSFGTDGRPLLSWRVHVLPYLGEDAAKLYKQFNLDEPWDSEHNLPLVKKMPEAYASPLRNMADVNNAGATTCLAPTNRRTAFFNRTGAKIQNFTDGTSNTILLATVKADSAIPWTKPDDWDVDLTDPLTHLKPDGPEAKYGFVITRADAFVQRISFETPVETIRALLTRAGGETIPKK